jgi:Uma2 family endonuclease
MLLLDRPRAAEAAMPMTLEEYLSLPEDARCEIVDGVARPMVRPRQLHREVQLNLTHTLKAQRPAGLRVAFDEVVILHDDPAKARIPDVVLTTIDTASTGRGNFTPVDDVLLVVEVVSESTQTADRYEKPGEYARAGIPSFWRIELEPSIVVWTYRLLDGVYHDEGRFTLGDTVQTPRLPWVAVGVTDLLGDFAPKT